MAEAKLDLERRNYLAMVEFCESAAVLCERRHEELFGAGGPTGGFAAKPRQANATTLVETIENMRKLSIVSDRWEETFAAYPSSLSEGKLASLFEHLSVYAEDLEAFTKGVESLKDSMKRKAGEGNKPADQKHNPPTQPNVVARPQQQPAPKQSAQSSDPARVVVRRTERYPGPSNPR